MRHTLRLSQGVGNTEERTFPRGEGKMSLLESGLGPRQAPDIYIGIIDFLVWLLHLISAVSPGF